MKKNPQSGFIMMIMIVIMVVGAAVYFGGVGENLFKKSLTTDQLNRMKELQDVKEKVLEYALQHDQIHLTRSAEGSPFYSFSKIAGPGYLPCPDREGSGEMSTDCKTESVSRNGFIHGFLPNSIKGRNFYFTQEFFKDFNGNNQNASRFYYVVHEQFVVNNSNYTNTLAVGGNLDRFAPLNSSFSPSSSTLLSLDGSQQYIAIFVSPGKPQTFPDGPTQNQSNPAVQNFLDYGVKETASGDLVKVNGNVTLDNKVGSNFYNRNRSNNFNGVGINDVIIGITLKEWQELVLSRVKSQSTWLCSQINPNEAVWFNAYDSVTNPAGGGWRGIVC